MNRRLFFNLDFALKPALHYISDTWPNAKYKFQLLQDLQFLKGGDQFQLERLS